MNDNIYEFSYRDEEGDTYTSDEYPSIASAIREIKIVQKEGGTILETWCYKNGIYKGSFNY